MPQLTAELALQLLSEHGSSRKAAAASGYSISALLRHAKPFRLPDGSLPPQTVEVRPESYSNDDVGVVAEEVAAPQVGSPVYDVLGEAARLAGVPVSSIKRSWIRPGKDGGKPTATIESVGGGVEADLSSDFVALLDSARKQVLRVSECRSADSMLIISPVDAHFGKLAYKKEAGENYDPEITSAVYRQAVSDALTYFNPSRIKRIMIPIGSDMMHTDNLKSMTTSGTVVDSTDTRYHRVFDIAVAAVIAAIEDCVEVADVFVPVIVGNHDEFVSPLIAKVVRQYFRFDSRVTVDDSEISRKYIQFGTNLIGMTHRFAKWDTAPHIMAVEAPKAWAETTCRELHCGHLHHRSAVSYRPYYETQGVVVRVLSSLSAADKWHHDGGFIGALRAAESYLYSEETGLIGSHLAKVRQ